MRPDRTDRIGLITHIGWRERDCAAVTLPPAEGPGAALASSPLRPVLEREAPTGTQLPKQISPSLRRGQLR